MNRSGHHRHVPNAASQYSPYPRSEPVIRRPSRSVVCRNATGAVATHLEHLRASGEDLSESLFEPTPQPPQQELY